LTSGNTSSCGCIRSVGENIIKNTLQQNNINFQQEYYFYNLKHEQYLRFDFFIDNKYLIEFDGIQHFYAVKK